MSDYDWHITAWKFILNAIIGGLSAGVGYLISLPPEQNTIWVVAAIAGCNAIINYFKHR